MTRVQIEEWESFDVTSLWRVTEDGTPDTAGEFWLNDSTGEFFPAGDIQDPRYKKLVRDLL